ncbi:MAG: ATP-binding cassette domain-containing protein [Ignavibacteriales bacterium]|nr:ATP-binding cassette domain-containing protein [Ignavibacteriales bacterium]
MKIFLRILAYVQPYWRTLVLSILCTIMFSIFSGSSIYLTIPLLETLFEQTETETLLIQTPPKNELVPNEIITFKQTVEKAIRNFLFRGTKSDALLRICILIFVVFFFKNIFEYAQSYLMAYVEQSLMRDIRDDLYRHLHNLSLSYFTNERTGNLISRVTNDVNVVNGGVSASFVTMVKEPLLIIVFLSIAFTLSWKLTLLAFVVFPFSLLFISAIALRLHKQSGVMQEKMADITSVLQETISNVKVVKAFAMEDFETKKFKRETQNYFRIILRLSRIRNLSSPTTELLSILAGAVIIWFGGQQVLISGEMKAAEFLGFLFVIFQVMPPIKELTSVNNRLQEFSAAGKRIFEILDTKPAIQSIPGAAPLDTIKNSIEYHNVTFAYSTESGEHRTVLSSINMKVKKGELIALVGPSGSGKTTFVDLLARFYDPIGGAIYIDGIDIKTIDVKSLREKIGIVTQETILFNDTVRNNIAYGLSECPLDKIVDAAKAANALSFIEDMPGGFESVIGDRGVKLSGGQRQRISIARALLKNPPIMIFDEATSALDSESEILVQEAMERLMQNRTSFVIAHRLSTIRNADRILVLDRGMIVQEGRHVDLLKQKNGLYKKLHDMQFSGA